MRSSTIPALAVVAGVAACAGVGGSSFVTDPDPRLEQRLLRSITGGVQPVEIYGTPPDGSPPEAVAAVMSAPGFFNPTTYRATTGPLSGARIVIEFGKTASGGGACVSPSGSPSAAPTRIAAAICVGGKLEHRVGGTISAAGPSDPAFESAMDNLMLLLIQRDEDATVFGDRD